MKRAFHTKDGVIDRELTAEELKALAALGDMEAKRELFKSEWIAADTLEKKLSAISKRLG